MSREILDLSDVIDSYDTLKIKDKEYRVGQLSTESVLKLEKEVINLKSIEREITELEEKIKSSEGKVKKDIEENLENLRKTLTNTQLDLIPTQIFIILQEGNEVTIEEIKAWGFNAQLKFMEWFNQPFLDLNKNQEAKEEVIKETQE